MAIKTDGTLWAWGANESGELGIGSTTNQLSPVQVGTATNWASAAGGGDAFASHTMALKTDGTLWAWGDNEQGQLGESSCSPALDTPVQVGTDTNWASVTAGFEHTLGVKTDGTLWAWGYNHYGQVGDGTVDTYRCTPVQVGTDTNWASTSAGDGHTAAIRTDGTLWTWGDNHYGQLGDGSFPQRVTPNQVGTAADWASVTAGFAHTVAIKTDGTLWAWGHNASGQLGDGTTTDRFTPVQVGSATNWSSTAAGLWHTVAVKTDGTLWAWGYNDDGQLGIGTIGGGSSSPVQVGAATNWASVAAGYQHTVALKTDGTLWSWGYNGQGQLGDGSTTTRGTPVQVGTATNWASVAAGWGHTVALKTDGSLWSWGDNGVGELGVGATGGEDSSPVQVGAATNWASVVAGYWHTAAVKTDGTLWAWGSNMFGQLGNGGGGCCSAPTQVGTATDWSPVAAGYYHTVAVKADGTLWAWGRNDSGQLGDGTTTNRFTPVPVGLGHQWVKLAGGGSHTMALARSGLVAPGAPTMDMAAKGDGEATVSWTAPASDGGSPITGYVVTAYVGYTPVKARIFNSTATTETLMGLTNGATYRFRVRAYNAVGVSNFSKASNAVTPTPGL